MISRKRSAEICRDLRADLVEGVLGGVVVAVGQGGGAGAVVDVDDVEDGDAALLEGEWSSCSASAGS